MYKGEEILFLGDPIFNKGVRLSPLNGGHPIFYWGLWMSFWRFNLYQPLRGTQIHIKGFPSSVLAIILFSLSIWLP